MTSRTSPRGLFASISLLMIVVMLTATGFTQASFFRQTIIDREAVIVSDMLNALALEHGVTELDLSNYSDADARSRLNQSFNLLKSLSDFVHVKVFNRDDVIVWSDDPILVGTKRTAHLAYLTQALQGEIRAVINPAVEESTVFDRGPAAPETIEFYVPLLHKAKTEESVVIGALALYRSPIQLNQAIQHGLYLLWTVIGAAGLVLFVALFKLFNSVYSRQKSAELKFSRLTADHQRIVQIEKLSAMGEMVGEIAHQLNNPLVGVLNLTQLAERECGDPNRVKELLAEVRKAGLECRDTVQRILRINKSSKSEPQATDMKELVLDTVKFCAQSIGHHHVIEFEALDHDVVLNVDPVLIRHALFNLIHNAILAAPEGVVKVTLIAHANDGVPGYQLGVTDAGNGFSAEIAAKLFKPFFTTREHGTGLGLSVAQHIAMKHGGSVRAENIPSGGCQFSIWLPAITTL